MKSLIFVALVVQVFAGPPGRPGGSGPSGGRPGPKPSGLPPTGDVHPFDHHNVTGQPPHDNSSRQPHPEGAEGHPRHRREVPGVSGSAPPKTGNPPKGNDAKPTGGPPPSGKPPGQGPLKPRPKRHQHGAEESHPTGAPHGRDHTHESGVTRPSRSSEPANGGHHKPGNKPQRG